MRCHVRSSQDKLDNLNILILFNPYSLQTLFVQQHLGCFQQFSRHTIHYAAATFENEAHFQFDRYDAVVLHFGVRLCFEGVLAPGFADALRSFRGPKILLIQDEYDLPFVAAQAMADLGIDVVFTTVPEEFRSIFYPPERVPGVTFRQCLTAYVPYERPAAPSLPAIAERATWIGYRGRKLPVWYGRLAAEKHEIGPHIMEACRRHGIPHDIRGDEDSRINGAGWFDFLMRSRAVLGTESGANVVDCDGAIRAGVLAEQERNPHIGETELYETLVAQHDGRVRMNQISPKIFEAIALKTALILFEGSYSGVLSKDHYIELKKDYSNVDDVLKRVSDVAGLQAMVDRAYADIVATGRYSYEVFVRDVEREIEQRVTPRAKPVLWTYAVIAADDGAERWRSDTFHLPLTQPLPDMPPIVPAEVPVEPERRPLLKGPLRRAWLALPEVVRRPIIRLAQLVIDR